MYAPAKVAMRTASILVHRATDHRLDLGRDALDGSEAQWAFGLALGVEDDGSLRMQACHSLFGRFSGGIELLMVRGDHGVEGVGPTGLNESVRTGARPPAILFRPRCPVWIIANGPPSHVRIIARWGPGALR